MDNPTLPADLPPTGSWGAVVLSGGGGERMGGIDKAGIRIGGATLLERVLAALGDVADVVVVGPEVPTSRAVTFTREDPTGGGPAAALLAGVRAFEQPPDLVVVLAVDLPRVTRATVQRLQAAVVAEGAVLSDGRRQHLCAAYRTQALLAAAPTLEDQPGISMRALVGQLRLAEVTALADEARDIDTWQDLRELSES